MNAKINLHNGTTPNRIDITLHSCEWLGTVDEIRVLTAAFNHIEVISNETGELLFQQFVAPCMFSQLVEIPNALATFLAEDEDEEEEEDEDEGGYELPTLDPDEFHRLVQSILGDKDEDEE